MAPFPYIRYTCFMYFFIFFFSATFVLHFARGARDSFTELFDEDGNRNVQKSTFPNPMMLYCAYGSDEEYHSKAGSGPLPSSQTIKELEEINEELAADVRGLRHARKNLRKEMFRHVLLRVDKYVKVAGEAVRTASGLTHV